MISPDVTEEDVYKLICTFDAKFGGKDILICLVSDMDPDIAYDFVERMMKDFDERAHHEAGHDRR